MGSNPARPAKIKYASVAEWFRQRSPKPRAKSFLKASLYEGSNPSWRAIVNKIKNEMKNNIDILKSIVMDRDRQAILSHASAGVLYYMVVTETGTYMFPVDMNDKADVGDAEFRAGEKAVTLMRYIRKAIESDRLIKISAKMVVNPIR